MDISIVIVNYKSKGLTLNCIKSITEADFGPLSREIIVVDNASNDAIGEILAWQYPEVIFIANPENVGMGSGNNVGIRRARGEYVVVMNPDTIAFPDTFVRFHEFMEANPRVGLAGPKQFNPDQTVQDSAYRWHSLFMPLYRRTGLGRLSSTRAAVDRFLMRDYDKREPRDVDWVLGSCLFIRMRALREVGMFDERYFLYFEETDLCRRFWEKNWRVVYYPLARIIHNHDRASARQPWYTFFMSRMARNHVRSWILYLFKWGIRRPKSHS